RADPEDEDVLAGDVRGVLHPRQARLEKGEAGLHEHDEDCRDHDPDRVGGDQEVCVAHLVSTSSSVRPERLCVTFSTRLVQTSPSPDSLPERAESAIASTTAVAISSSTMNVRRAFGRKRDSKTRPRYSWVTPRWRPWPIASTTVTPTWPVSSSTASITVSIRSRITTASIFVTGFSFLEAPRLARHRPAARSALAPRPRGSRTASAGRGLLRSPGRRRSRASRCRPPRSFLRAARAGLCRLRCRGRLRRRRR